MLVRIKGHWQNVVRGFWFFPGLVALALSALALVLVEVDQAAGPDGVPHAFDGDASAARTVLATVSGSLITVAGLAFSITIVTLQLVSGQLTPRAMRSFLGDRPSQLIAGAFVGIFAYCLLVLRAVRDEAETFAGFVPALSVTVGIVLGLVGLMLLLAFIHRITQLVKVENITARIAGELAGSIDSLYPEPYGAPVETPGDELVPAWERSGEPALVRTERPGYVRSILLDQLDAVGLPAGARVHVTVRPGDQVTAATPVVRVWPAGAVDERCRDRLRGIVDVQGERDVAQDAAFGLRQLADIALRAVSPGVNDPTTAVTCIGYLRDALERLAAREFPQPVRRLEEDRLVVAVASESFESFLDEAFVEIGRFSAGDARVASTVLEALAGIAAAAADSGAHARLGAIAALAEDVAAPALEDARTGRDRATVEAGLERVRSVCAAT